MQAGHDDLTEPFELFLPDESPEDLQDEQRSRVFGLDATPFVGFDEACAPVAKNAERLSRPLKRLFPRDGRDGAEGSSPGESKRARRGAIGDVTLAPLVRNRPPREGEAPLSTVIVDDNSRFGYRPGWVIVSLKITNRCKRGLCFTCEKIRLAWNGITMNLVPPDLNAWTVETQRTIDVSTLAPIMVNGRTLEPASPLADVRLDLLCDTSKQRFPVDIRAAVWRSHLRPAFFDERSVVLVSPPGATAQREEREYARA